MPGENEPNRRERKKAQTKNRLIETALGLFFRQGFAATSMEQVAEEADVAKGTLYNYFPTKESLILEHIHGIVREKEAEFNAILQGQPDTRSRLLVFLSEVSQWYGLNKDLMGIYVTSRLQNLFQAAAGPGEQSGFGARLARILELGQVAGEIRPDIPAKWLANYFATLYLGVLTGWLYSPEQFPLGPNLEQAVDLFLNGSRRQG